MARSQFEHTPAKPSAKRRSGFWLLPPPALEGAPLLLRAAMAGNPAIFALLCNPNPEAVLERTSSGRLIQATQPGGDPALAADRC